MNRDKILNNPIINITIRKLKPDELIIGQYDVYIGYFLNEFQNIKEYGKSEGEVLDLLLDTYKNYYNLEKFNCVINLNITK